MKRQTLFASSPCERLPCSPEPAAAQGRSGAGEGARDLPFREQRAARLPQPLPEGGDFQLLCHGSGEKML